MDVFPLFLNLHNQPCLVVGGGDVAARKAALLCKAGAQVTVVSPVLGNALTRLATKGQVKHQALNFDPLFLEGMLLAIAATDDEKVNQAVAEAARAQRVLVNVVDRPALCSFIMPSIVDRSPVVVAISSGGASPVLARLLRARLETLIPASYGKLAALVAGFRERVKKRFSTLAERRGFWETILQGPVAEMMYGGREHAARKALENALMGDFSLASQGSVALVGGGPGDPDLLTFRALRLLQEADVVVYDRLVSSAVLELSRRDAETIYVGKERDNHTLPQESINDLLVRLAREGKRVVRLKGGDPFIFGRGGEEIETLMTAGIPFQVVPGITAAAGCAAYAGIPLTHRDYSQSVMFVTGHLKDGSVDLNWDALIQPRQTLVLYMGLVGLPVICHELVQRGMAADTPAALVEQGTTPKQRVIIGSLSTLPGLVTKAKVQAPTLVIVGDVVKLHEKLAWFEPSELS